MSNGARRLAAVAAGGLLVAALVACGGGSDRFLSLGTAPPGGGFFPFGGALAAVLNENAGERGWSVTAEATKGSQENIRRLVRGEIDFALSNSAITYFALRGEGGWDKPHAVRAVMTLAPNVAMFVAPKSNGIGRMADLVGKRVVVGPAGAGFWFFIGPLLDAHNLTDDDISPLNATQTDAVDLLANGTAAAAFLGGAVPTASITQAASSQDIVLVPFERDAVEALLRDYVFFAEATIPAGTYPGQDEPFHGLDVGSMHLITAADTDPDLVYDVTRILYEQREQIVAKHPAGRSIRADNVARNTGTEFHPGAIRYYREIGVWPEDTTP